MRKLRIIFFTAFLFGGLFLNQQQARAQFVVSDPTNLVQSILQYIQDQMREGNFDPASGLSKLEGMRQEFQALHERIEQVKTIIAAWEKIKDITYVTEMIMTDFVNMQRLADLIGGLGTYGTVSLVDNLANSYKSVANSLLSDVKKQCADISTITQSDPLKILDMLHEKIEYLYQGYLVLHNYFYSSIARAYYAEMNLKARLEDERFLNQLFI